MSGRGRPRVGDVDEGTVIDVGGWDGRFAVVRAVRTLGDRAAAVIDANGDGADLNLEHFRRVDGVWRLCSSGGGAGDAGRDWYDGLWAEHGRDGDGWWLTLAPGPAPDDVPMGVGGAEAHGWVAYVPHRRGDRWRPSWLSRGRG